MKRTRLSYVDLSFRIPAAGAAMADLRIYRRVGHGVQEDGYELAGELMDLPADLLIETCQAVLRQLLPAPQGPAEVTLQP